MKKIKTLLIITLCLTFVLTNTPFNTSNEPSPLDHYSKDVEKI